MERSNTPSVWAVDEYWAVVEYGNRRFLGRLNLSRDEYLNKWVSEPLVICPAIELIIVDMPQPDPNNPRSVGIARMSSPTNYALNAHPTEIILTNPGPIAFLSSMHPDDREVYKNAVSQLTKALGAQRAARAGIVVPGAQR